MRRHPTPYLNEDRTRRSPGKNALKRETMCFRFSLTAQVVVRRGSHIVPAEVRLVFLDEI
jgi:hypothetical protein